MPNHYRGAERRKAPRALSAGGIKELVHLWKTNRLFRYDISIILAQDMNSSVILMAGGAHSGTGGAERHVLHMVNCLAAGIPRSEPPPRLISRLIAGPLGGFSDPPPPDVSLSPFP